VCLVIGKRIGFVRYVAVKNAMRIQTLFEIPFVFDRLLSKFVIFVTSFHTCSSRFKPGQRLGKKNILAESDALVPFPELLRALKRDLVYDNIFPKITYPQAPRLSGGNITVRKCCSSRRPTVAKGIGSVIRA
jgi:hypothetical protein